MLVPGQHVQDSMLQHSTTQHMCAYRMRPHPTTPMHCPAGLVGFVSRVSQLSTTLIVLCASSKLPTAVIAQRMQFKLYAHAGPVLCQSQPGAGVVELPAAPDKLQVVACGSTVVGCCCGCKHCTAVSCAACRAPLMLCCVLVVVLCLADHRGAICVGSWWSWWHGEPGAAQQVYARWQQEGCCPCSCFWAEGLVVVELRTLPYCAWCLAAAAAACSVVMWRGTTHTHNSHSHMQQEATLFCR